MRLPTPRGPVSQALNDALTATPATVLSFPVSDPARPDDDAVALWTLHELHYRGFDDVDDRWEWAPGLMPLRERLEGSLEQRLRSRYAQAHTDTEGSVVDAVERVIAAHEGPSLARHVQRHATHEETLELLRQRSIYHLKEADPTSWVVARLEAEVKAPLMSIQYDEYGAGRADRLHHAMFGRGLAAAGLDATYGAYIDGAVLEVIEQNNALSLFGLHRRLRGAAVGHFAAFEATSAVPSRQLVQGLERLGFAPELVAYYDEHIEADAVHEQVVLREVCARLVEAEPDLRSDLLLGVWTCLELESRTATALLDSWEAA